MSKPKPIPAQEALKRLKVGNARFVKTRDTGSLAIRRNFKNLMLKTRPPFAIILSCSDSRAPSELLFDQGLGDLFVIRVAGNITAPSLVGSVEFAAATTGAKLVVVMGHTQCGAIQATYDMIVGKKWAITENVHDIVDRIRPHVSHLMKRKGHREKVLREAMRANALASANHLRHGSRFLEDLVRQKKLLVVAAEYCIETGQVDFFDVPTTGKIKA